LSLLLKTKFTIRLAAGFFLILFSLCITPKRFLHDLLAHHTDQQTLHEQPFNQVGSTGYHCHIDDLVVVEPFLPCTVSAVVKNLQTFSIRYHEPLVSFPVQSGSFADGRAPPAAFCS
jgi:hypothetical protein